MMHRLVHADAKDIPWQPMAIRGTALKILNRQPESGATVALVRIEGGYEIPPHRHGQLANAYIVSGSIRDADGTLMSTGSYLRIPSFVRHGPFRAEGEMVALLWFPCEPSFFFDDGSTVILTPEGMKTGTMRL